MAATVPIVRSSALKVSLLLELQLRGRTSWLHNGFILRVYSTGLLYGFTLRVLFTGSLLGSIIRVFCLELLYS
jgi:hypothetical protein